MTLTSLRPTKSSGYEWLGDIPNQWDVEKFRYVFSESQEKIESPTEIEGEMLSVSGYRGIEVKSYEDETLKRKPDELVNYRIVKPNQLVVNTMWLNYAGLGVSEHVGYVSPAYRSYSIRKDLSTRFIHHLMRSDIYVKGYTRLLTGIRPNSLQMGRDDLMAFPVITPPLKEQQKIAQFLDYETAKIDALIDEQKRLIELLKEKRQAVISHAVTKGLNPDAPMKDSGVDWLGEVPEHWKVASLKAFIRLVESGTSVNAADTPASEGELGVLKTSAVYGDELDVNQNKTVVKEEESRVSCQLKANRLIVSRMNTPELVGATGFSLTNPGNLFLPDRLWQITLENVESQFIFMFTLSKSYRSQIKLVCAGASSSMQNIAQEDFKNVKIAVPPLIEQKAIVDEWHRFKSNSNQLTEQAEKAVKLLQERRSALISAAVTGKIDVRDWQPPAGSDTVDSNASMQTERHYG